MTWEHINKQPVSVLYLLSSRKKKKIIRPALTSIWSTPIEPGSPPVFFLLKGNFSLPPLLGHESGFGFLLSAYRES